MLCRCVVGILVGLLLAGQVRAQQQEEEVLGKKRSEWLKILKEHKESKYRRAAIIALGVIGPRATGVLPGLVEAMESDADPEIRREIATNLGLLGVDAKGTVDALAHRLDKDQNAKVREASARALGKLADYASIHVMLLGRALKDADPGTRAAAAESLKSFGDKARLVLPQLLEAAQDVRTDRFTRLYAVQILTKQAPEEEKTPQVLAAILTDKDTPLILRQEAAEGLGSLGPHGASALTGLIGVLKDAQQDKELRRAVAIALGKMGDKALAVWPTIQPLLADADVGLRYQSVRLAGKLGKGNPEVSAALLKRLGEEKNTEVLLAVIQELGELGARDALEPLGRLASGDGRQSVRMAATASVQKIKGL